MVLLSSPARRERQLPRSVGPVSRLPTRAATGWWDAISPCPCVAPCLDKAFAEKLMWGTDR